MLITSIDNLLIEIKKQIKTRSEIEQKELRPAKFNVTEPQNQVKESKILTPDGQKKMSITLGLEVVTDGDEVWLEQFGKILEVNTVPGLYKIRMAMLETQFKRNKFKIP